MAGSNVYGSMVYIYSAQRWRGCFFFIRTGIELVQVCKVRARYLPARARDGAYIHRGANLHGLYERGRANYALY